MGVLKRVNGGIEKIRGLLGSMGALVRVNGGMEKGNGGIEKGQWGQWGRWSGSMGVSQWGIEKGQLEALVRVSGIGHIQWGY